MAIRTLTTLLIGPGIVEWSTRELAKVRRIFGPSKAAPTRNDVNISGANGSSTNFGGTTGSVMIQGTPTGGIWRSDNGGASWLMVSSPSKNDA